MSRAAVSCPVARLSEFYATIFLVTAFSSRSGQSGSSLVALTAQSALMPIGDTVTLAVARSDALDYGRIRLWGSVSFILASLGSGTVLASTAGADALLLVLGASALLTLACLAVPQQRQPIRGSSRFADMRAFVGNRRFSVLSSVPRHCKPVTKSITVLELFTGARSVSRRRRSACVGLKAPVAEILLFWHGQRLLARFGPEGLIMIGGAAGIIRWLLSGRLTGCRLSPCCSRCTPLLSRRAISAQCISSPAPHRSRRR